MSSDRRYLDAHRDLWIAIRAALRLHETLEQIRSLPDTATVAQAREIAAAARLRRKGLTFLMPS